jgi:hypothetical protein
MVDTARKGIQVPFSKKLNALFKKPGRGQYIYENASPALCSA